MIALCSELWCNFTFARVNFQQQIFFQQMDEDDDAFRNLDPRRGELAGKNLVACDNWFFSNLVKIIVLKF